MNSDKRKTNEIICEFMGRRVVDGWVEIGGKFKSSFHSENLVYHLEWDELMPVIDKIDKLYSEAFPGNEAFIKAVLNHEKPIDEHYMDVISLPIATPINEVYDAVIKFIKWHNETEIKK